MASMDYAVARLPRRQGAAGSPDHHAPPPPVSQRTRGSSLMRQQRRVALEQEVAELKQQLSNEETVHHILERALLEGGGGSVAAAVSSIPAFIPGKAKELLAELVLVEQEIARLEAQIKHMKGGGGGGISLATTTTTPSSSASPRTTADIKSMFFINQAMMAMDGDAYLLNKRHLLANDDDTTTQHKSRHSLDNNNSNNKQQQASKMIRRHDEQLIKTTSRPARRGTTDNKVVLQQQPNKLSERILKCLVCIFIRLLRSSRAAELQQVDNNHHSFSLRMDTGLNNVATAATNSKDSSRERRGQQDHYAVFAIQDAIVRDIGPYKNLVRFTSSSSLDLQRAFSGSPLLTKLRGMLEALQRVDLRFLINHQHKLAFWLNIYNTCIMHGILQHGVPSNSDKLLALKNKATINVSGQMFNALVIENFILRQPSSMKEEFWKCDVDVDEQEVRGLYGLTSSEPNILFALCCGIRSSPALRIYKADRVVADLEKAKLEYLQASLVVTSARRRLMIPSLLHSNMHDFAKDVESLVGWICEQLPTSWSLRKSMVDCLRSVVKVDDVVDVIPFDYEFQYLLPMM